MSATSGSILKSLSQCKQNLLRIRERIENIIKSANSASPSFLETLSNQLSDIDSERSEIIAVQSYAQSISTVVHSYFQRVLNLPNCLHSFRDSGGFILNLGQKIKWESAKSAAKTKNVSLFEAVRKANAELSAYFKSKNKNQFTGKGLYWQEIYGISPF